MIRAELEGSETATAAGITVRTGSPVIALCKALVAAGHDPAEPMEVFRGSTLALRVRSIGEGARLVVAGNGVGFRRLSAMDTSRPMRQNEEAARPPQPDPPEAPVPAQPSAVEEVA